MKNSPAFFSACPIVISRGDASFNYLCFPREHLGQVSSFLLLLLCSSFLSNEIHYSLLFSFLFFQTFTCCRFAESLFSWLFHFDSPLTGVSTSPRQLHISARPSLLFFLRRHSGPLERSPLPQDLVVRPLVSRVTQKSCLVFNDLSSTTTHALYTTKIPSNSITLSTSYDF